MGNEIVITVIKADNGWIITGNDHVLVAKTGIYELETAFRQIVEGWNEAEEVKTDE